MESNESEGNISSSSLVDKVVPWVSWDEWNCVRRSIFSSSPKLIYAALQKISAWESRGCLPIAIELTAVVVEIHRVDPFFRVDGSIADALASEKMLSEQYCMFIVRLVNDTVEAAHKKTGHSISDLAEKAGIPRTLIDIRHESTHQCLPSLKRVRSASVKALEWLKANYWEPQSVAVHDPRREVKSRLHELILCLREHKVSRVNSAKNKRKRSKVHICKLIRRVARLYSLYPSEVVSVLLEIFLSQASDISDGTSMEHSDDSDCSILKPILSSLTDLETVITKVSHKKPRLLLGMLKAILETIEEKDAMKFKDGGSDFSQNQVQMDQVHLRSLIPYLIRNLKALKESGRIILSEENKSLSTYKITTPKVILAGLLRKCLASSIPGDDHLIKSALLLAEMSKNRVLVQKLKKLPLFAVLDHNQHPSNVGDYTGSMLLEEEDSVKKAAERLDHIKLRLVNRKNRTTRHSGGNSGEATGRWTVTKSWVPCPIGMLPCSFSSTAVIPVLDVIEGQGEADESQIRPNEEENEDEEEEAVPALESPFLMEGRLLIGGLWKKVSEEELVSIESDIRTFA